MSDKERYQQVGTIDGDAIDELGYDATQVFESISEAASDISVVHIGGQEHEQLWHRDYDDGLLSVGTFDSMEAAWDAMKGLENSQPAFNYSDKKYHLYAQEPEDD